MINRAIVFFVLSACLFISPAFAKQFQTQYTDPQGNKWQRWIILEEQDKRATLLVVENPMKDVSQRLTTQVVVEKSTLVNLTAGQIQTKVNYFRYLKDLKTRSSSYYRAQENEVKLNKTPTPLWVPVKNDWTEVDENKFAAWFKKNASTTMAVGAGLEFDCADFGLLGRWIYAHDNKLPMMTSLAGSGKLFGHFSESKNWSNLPTNEDWKKDERFKAAMRYLFDSTYTHSIFNDLYPTKISKDYVTPGAIILTLRSGNTGHTQVVYDVGMQNYCGAECISVLYGNEPSREYAYKTQADIRYHEPAGGGFLRWRWPLLKNGKWQLTPKTSMPGYSLEQYGQSGMSFDEFNNYVYESLGFKVEPYKKAYSLANSLSHDLNDRMSITAQGTIFCYYQFCDPQGAVFDQYSTPSKDKRFREKRDQLLRLFDYLTPYEQSDLISTFKTDLFVGRNGVPVTAADYIFNANGISDRMSSDPSVSFEQRWGLENLNTRQSVLLKASFFLFVWRYRIEIVNNAIRICGDGVKPICDPLSPDITKLSTSTMDASLRTAHKEVTEGFGKLSYSDRRFVTNASDRLQLHKGCEDNLYGYCSLSDYLFLGTTYVDKMSSKPIDSFRKRMGLD
tara:strand:+ start:22668 stop:24524 length:1857 start_codon:yes stop_codon:yes gene_type:complete